MDAITQFQNALAEPASGFIGAFWPFLAVIAIVAVAWFFNPHWRNSNGDVFSSSSGGNRGADSDDGDGD